MFELKALLQESKSCCTFHQPSPTASANPATSGHCFPQHAHLSSSSQLKSRRFLRAFRFSILYGLSKCRPFRGRNHIQKGFQLFSLAMVQWGVPSVKRRKHTVPKRSKQKASSRICELYNQGDIAPNKRPPILEAGSLVDIRWRASKDQVSICHMGVSQN